MTEAEERRRLHYDHTGRTPQDYAIEHAGYLATAARNFLSRLDAEFDASEALEAAEAADAEDAAEKADDLNSIQQEVADHHRALRSAIYEFEKRRDRAAAAGVSAAVEAQPVAWRVRGYNQFKTGTPGAWRYFDGADQPRVNDPEDCDIEPLYGDAGVAPSVALGFTDGWQHFVCYLIDHAEGETISEEALHRWAAAFLKIAPGSGVTRTSGVAPCDGGKQHGS